MNLTKKAVVLTAALLITATGVQAKNFKMALGDAQGGTQWELGTKFAELFKEKSGGKHKVRMYPNGQLGSEQDTVNDAAIFVWTPSRWQSPTRSWQPRKLPGIRFALRRSRAT